MTPVWGSILFMSGRPSVQHAHVKSRRRSAYWRIACKDLRHHPKDSMPIDGRARCKRCLKALDAG